MYARDSTFCNLCNKLKTEDAEQSLSLPDVIPSVRRTAGYPIDHCRALSFQTQLRHKEVVRCRPGDTYQSL